MDLVKYGSGYVSNRINLFYSDGTGQSLDYGFRAVVMLTNEIPNTSVLQPKITVGSRRRRQRNGIIKFASMSYILYEKTYNRGENNMRVSKDERGITLIALVITIIVMLILVAVTINIAVNGGLFGYAGNAARETEQAKNDEQNWASVEGGLSTEALIAKFTTNKAEDLAKLRLYFTGPNGEGKMESQIFDENGNFGNNDIISDASTSITFVNSPVQGDDLIIKYHNNLYKLSGEDVMLGEDNYDWKFTSVEELSDSEILITRIANEGKPIKQMDDFIYVEYNHKVYKVIANPEGWSVEEASATDVESLMVTITFTSETNVQQTISFIPTQGQTWINWAGTTGDDIDLSSIQSGLTLKSLIIQKNATTDMRIKIADYALLPPASNIPQLTTSTINFGGVYFVKSISAVEEGPK